MPTLFLIVIALILLFFSAVKQLDHAGRWRGAWFPRWLELMRWPGTIAGRAQTKGSGLKQTRFPGGSGRPPGTSGETSIRRQPVV